MMKTISLAFLGICFTLAPAAVGQEKCDKGSCPVSEGMAKLPKMTYLVGTESTCCSKSAEKLAKESDEPIRFVVAEESYDDEGKAMEALAEVTEQFVNDFASAKTCKASGTTTIAGQSVHCSKKASHMAKVIKDAMQLVSRKER
jgi:hypothetical protein